MLTISQLAAYAGVTVRAVRHYHQIGLLAEPARDASGYRTYGAGDVVRLIRIRTLAEAGVPLARVQELLDASPEEFEEALTQVDAELRAKVRELQDHRRRIALLAAGDTLAVPAEVVPYLDRLRANGASQAMVEGERDGWILMAARWPEKIPELMVDKLAQLDDPRTVRLYQLLDVLVRDDVDDEQLKEVADLMVELAEQAAANGELDRHTDDLSDDGFIALVDAYASDSHPVVERLQQLMVERGWRGWARIERSPATSD
jgi:DNA-binding transcriptional MerR regulator